MRHIASICLLLAATANSAAGAAGPPSETTVIELVPAPPAAATREHMRRWHRHYRGRISPILREWEGLARAARERPGGSLTAGCRRLDLALTTLRRSRLPTAPDLSVSLHLEETLRSLSEAADSCTQGAYFLTTWRLREADNAWRELRGRLSLYGLEP